MQHVEQIFPKKQVEIKLEYFHNIKIGHYKGIKELNISRFSAVNMITGPNGSGKSTLTETLEIMTNPIDFSHYVKVTGDSFSGFSESFDKREQRPYTALSVTLLENPYSMEITSYFPITEQGFMGYHHCQYPVDGTVKTVSKEINHSFECKTETHTAKPLVSFRKVTPKETSVCFKTIWEDKKISEKVIALLSLFDDDISGFHTEDFQEYLIAHQKYGNLRQEFFSEGIKYFLKIAEQLANFRNGILVIDGLEYQFAKNTLYEIVNFIYQITKERQIQLFITTQSSEVIDEWLDIMQFYNELSALRILRLKAEKDKTTCLEYHGERAYQLRIEQEFDFRNEPS